MKVSEKRFTSLCGKGFKKANNLNLNYLKKSKLISFWGQNLEFIKSVDWYELIHLEMYAEK